MRHVFKSEAAMTLEFLKGRGVVAEEASDRTERTLEDLRARAAESRQLRPCPAETVRRDGGGSLISLYSQTRTIDNRDPEGQVVRQKMLTAVGVLCLRCSYRQFEQDALRGQHSPG